jgi:hypothetical protein
MSELKPIAGRVPVVHKHFADYGNGETETSFYVTDKQSRNVQLSVSGQWYQTKSADGDPFGYWPTEAAALAFARECAACEILFVARELAKGEA